MTAETILVIDDEEHIRRALRGMLMAKKYQVLLAASGEEGLSLAADATPDLVILDLSLPGMYGLDVCRALRGWYGGPILVLSVIEREAEKVAVLDNGADDYVTKPCRTGELLARVRALLRRATAPPVDPLITVGALTVDTARHRITLGGTPLHLTPIEYTILSLLARNAECVVTTRTVLTQVWGSEADGDVRTLRVHMKNLRRKLNSLGTDRRYIVTEPGIGFRFCMDEQT